MKTTHRELPFDCSDHLTAEIFTENAIFFDIETTGFSPAHTSLYLVGCARRRGNLICIDQFFAERPSEEKVILTAFLELLKQYQTIITFNGIGFDIPYLKAKCDSLSIEETFAEFSYVDIFKSISKLKHIFKLPNYKQKSLEDFLELTRNDLYSGGELINIYHAYAKDPDDDLLELLLLHNFEDVLGMIDLLPVMSYIHLLQGHFASISCTVDDCRTYSGEIEKEITFTITPEYPFPKKLSYGMDDLYLTCSDGLAKLSVHMTEEPLKYFFPNYRDYYYLPVEDMAVLKSIASGVDKDYREPAKAATCYIKKDGLFLPQYETLITPEFRVDYKDKISYFELTDDFLANEEFQRAYVAHLLSILVTHRPKM